MKALPSLLPAAVAVIFAHTLASGQTPAPAPSTTNPAKAGDGVQIGISRQDGVTVSADGAVVTRNGATEKLTKDLVLPYGVTVRPDGTVILPDKTEVPLRASQVLTFDGKILPLQVEPRANPGDPRGNGTGSTPAPGMTAGGAGGNARMAAGTSAARARGTSAAGGSVFLSSDGVPFMGTLNTDGTLLRADGTLIRADASIRMVTFAPDGTSSLGTVNNNGSITRADGVTVAPDGSVLGANGRILSPAKSPQNPNAAPAPANAAGTMRPTNPPTNPGTNNPATKR